MSDYSELFKPYPDNFMLLAEIDGKWHLIGNVAYGSEYADGRAYIMLRTGEEIQVDRFTRLDSQHEYGGVKVEP